MANKALGSRLKIRTQVRWAFSRTWLRVSVSAILLLLVVGADNVDTTQEDIEMAILALG
jgi:hypothetical protein